MNIFPVNKEFCCGCTACASICKHNAITMKPDDMGFMYPVFNETNCIDCGLCVQVCSFNKDYDTISNLETPIAFGARHKNREEVSSSRSGAAFIALSDIILDRGGVIYGVGFTDHFVVTHKRATTKTERNEFKGSKYVQSNLNGIFPKIKEDLKEGYHVLFSGTPCQCAGLSRFVGKNLRKNLVVIDIVCHSVPSPYIWRDYIDYLEKKEGTKIKSFNFRDKSRIGWAGHLESYVYENGKKEEARIFTKLFQKSLMQRPSCEHCPFTNTTRPSDLTIADFWGWEKVKSDFNVDNRGCSLILCNTPKGLSLFNEAKKDLYFFSADLKLCIQKHLKEPTKYPKEWKDFQFDYKTKGFNYILHRYSGIDTTWKYKFKTFLQKIGNKVYRIFVR